MSRLGGHPLEPGDHRDATGGEGGLQAIGPDLDDLGLGMDGIGDDAGLTAGVGGGLDPEPGQCHAQQGHRDPLPRAQQHVHFAGGLDGADVGGQPDQFVGGVAHGTDHHHHVIARASCPGDMVGHGADPLGIGDRGPAEFLHHQRHGHQGYRGMFGAPAPRSLTDAYPRGVSDYPDPPCPPRSVSDRRPAARPGWRRSRSPRSASGPSAGRSS